jgi:hypothetical protein
LYKKDNPQEKHQKAASLCQSSNPCLKRHRTPTSDGELVGAAYFWAEYSKVSNAEQWQTKQLHPQNTAFIEQGTTLPHSLTKLNFADCVSITFERQKSGRKWDTVTQWKSLDESLCPVELWASIVPRILSYKGTN